MTYEDGGNLLNIGMWVNVKYVNNLHAIHVFFSSIQNGINV